MAAQQLFYSVVTDSVKGLLRQNGITDVPTRRMTYAELASWIQGKVNNKDQNVMSLLRNHQAMNRIERLMGKAKMGTQFENLLGRHEKTARMVGRAGWLKEMGSVGRTGTSSRQGVRGGAESPTYQKVYQGILRGKKGALGAVVTPQGKSAIHNAVLRETGSYHKALEAVKFLEGEALRRVGNISRARDSYYKAELTSGGILKEEKAKMVALTVAEQRFGKRTRGDTWWKRYEAHIVHKLGRGDEMMFLRAINLELMKGPGKGVTIKEAMQKEGRFNEYRQMESRINQAIDRFINNTASSDTKARIAPVPKEERKGFLKEYVRRSRIAVMRDPLDFNTSSSVLTTEGKRDLPRGKFLERWNRRYSGKASGDVVLTFGKYKGKSLNWVFDNKPYYIAFLDSYSDGTSVKGTRGKMDMAINAYLQTPIVSKFLDDYYEEAGGSSPRDVQPYRDRRTGAGAKTKGGGRYLPNWNKRGQVSWRDAGVWRKGGFAVSDSTDRESVLVLGRGRVTNAGWDPEREEWVPGAGPLVGQEGGGNLKMEFLQNWKYRKKEYRWDRPGDMWDAGEFGKSLQMKEMMDVIGRHYSTYGTAAKGKLARLQKAIELAPYTATGLEQRWLQWSMDADAFFRPSKKVKFKGESEYYFDSERGKFVRREYDLPEAFREPSFGRGVYNKWAEGADPLIAEGGPRYLSARTLAHLGNKGTREDLMNWHAEFGNVYGWDVASLHAMETENALGGKSVEKLFQKAWNKVLARE